MSNHPLPAVKYYYRYLTGNPPESPEFHISKHLEPLNTPNTFSQLFSPDICFFSYLYTMNRSATS
jgi:hypothetical protein